MNSQVAVVSIVAIAFVAVVTVFWAGPSVGKEVVPDGALSRNAGSPSVSNLTVQGSGVLGLPVGGNVFRDTFTLASEG